AAGHEDVVAPGTFQEQVALAVGRHPVVHLPVVDPAFAIRQAFGLLGGGAATTRVGLDLDAVGLRGQLRIGDVGQEAHLAHAGLPAVAEQERGGGPRVLGLVAVVVVDAAGDLAPRLVERLAGAQVDGAAQAAFDDLGVRVLVHVHAGHQLGGDFLEADAAAAVGAEHVAAVELAAHEGQAADHHAAAFGREVVGIVARREAGDGQAADALEGFGDAAVGQRADVFGGHRIDDLGSFLLDVL